MGVVNNLDQGRATVLVWSDHKLVAEGLRALLSQMDGLEVVAAISDQSEVPAELLEQFPDIIVCDASTDPARCDALLRDLSALTDRAPLLILAPPDLPPSQHAKLAMHAKGYVLKTVQPEDLALAIRSVVRGYEHRAPIATEALRTQMAHQDELNRLTPRQREVLRLIASGASSREAAEILGLKPKTVENYRAQLMDRLGLDSLAAMVRFAIRTGLVSQG